MSKKGILIILIAAILVIGIGILFYLNLTKKSPEETNKEAIKFSNDFIKDFTTYEATKPENYNERLTKYISPEYLSDFSDTYFLPTKIDALSEDEIKSSSKYVGGGSKILSEKGNLITLKAEYEALVKNPPELPNETKKINAALITIEKDSGDKFLVTNFSFATSTD